MNIEVMNDPDMAFKAANCLKWGIIYKNNGIILDRIDSFNKEFTSIDMINEARFFSENEEIHVFRKEGKLFAVKTSGSSDEAIETSYVLDKTFGLGSVKVRKYLDYDEDGQAYVVKTCLSGVEVSNGKD